MRSGALGQYALGEITFEDSGVFLLTGLDVELTYFVPNKGRLTALGELAIGEFSDVGETFALAAGAFTLAGQDMTPAVGYNLVAGAGAFVLTGQDAALTDASILIGETGAFTLTGQDTVLTQTHLDLTADVGTFTLTGQDAIFREGYALFADPGEFTLSGQTLVFARDKTRIRLNMRVGGGGQNRLRAA